MRRGGRFSFELLKSKCGGRLRDVIAQLDAPNTSAIYRLKDPERYGFPDAVFDARSDYARRIADAAGVETHEVVNFYLELWRKHGEVRSGRA